MSLSTRATLALNKVEVNFTLHRYDYDPDAERIGLQAAEAIGVEPRRVLKTLMAEVHGKTARMMRPTDAERLTGYHVGGISPFAQKKRVPVAIDEAAMSEKSIFLNGGQRGRLSVPSFDL